MELSVNDTFKSKEDLIDAISSYADSIHFKFIITETPRTLSFVCKGKQEFNCDASIVTSFKKKDDCFSIKRMKLTHKCPIANNDFASTDEFLRNEIFTNISDYSSTRIGDIVSILYNRGIRVSFTSVYYILKGKSSEEHEVGLETYKKMDTTNTSTNDTDINNDIYTDKSFFSSHGVKESSLSLFTKDSFKKFNEFNPIAEDFCSELSLLNPDRLDIKYWGKMLFYKVKDYINILYPLVEIKYYRRKTGLAVFGVLYDPLNEPVVYSCCVSEDIEEEEALRYFLHHTGCDKYIIEYDTPLIKLLEELNIDYFVKTRDVCKYLYSEESTKENLEKVWNICNDKGENNEKDLNHNVDSNKENGINTNNRDDDKNHDADNEVLTPTLISEILHIKESHFIKSKAAFKLLNINNLPECDLDFINYGVYSLPFFECVNAIVKLSLDNLKIKKKFIRQDPKSLFGYNVTNRIERNESTIPKEDCQVDLEKGTCECGLYQELLIPCVHVCKYLREQRLDPYLYVSSVYSKDQYSKLEDIHPVMSINIKVSSDRFNFKKGPGRPKKSYGKEVEIVVE